MNGMSIRKSAKACGINPDTAFKWRHKILGGIENDRLQRIKSRFETLKKRAFVLNRNSLQCRENSPYIKRVNFQRKIHHKKKIISCKIDGDT